MPDNMYPDTKTWNPFVGCRFNCIYCEKSFKRQLKRVAWNIGCQSCYEYEPHEHPTRLATAKIPSAPVVFVYGTGDIAFCAPPFVWKTFNVIDRHRPKMDKEYYFQSKAPSCFEKYLDWFLENVDKVTLLTTLETNRDEGYTEISKAPLPTVRFKDFYDLDYPKKAVTIEPVLDFDLEAFCELLFSLHDQGTLEYVWFGFDSKRCGLPEPSEDKAQRFVDALQDYGIEVRGKSLRGVVLRGPSR